MLGGLWVTFEKHWPEETERPQIQMGVSVERPSGTQPNGNDVQETLKRPAKNGRDTACCRV